LTEY